MKQTVTAILLALLCTAPSFASHYLPKPGEKPINIRIGTCAITGGFVHLYAGQDYGIFEKYGLKTESIFIRGSGPALAALASDELQFIFCAADGTIPGIATGIDVKLVASPLVKLPYVLISRKEIRRGEDLKGKAIGIARAGDLSDKLSRAVIKKFGLTPDMVSIRPIGGSQGERYQAMAANIVQAVTVTPPLDARAKNAGFNVLYRLIDLDLPFIYSTLHTSHKMLRDRPELVQRAVAAFAEAVHFVEKNPDKAKASIAKAHESQGRGCAPVLLQRLRQRNRRPHHVSTQPSRSPKSVESARESGTTIRRKPEEIYDNSFVNNLEKSGFLKEIWGSENYRR